MRKCLFCTHAFFWVHLQQTLDQAQALRAQFPEIFFLQLIQILDLWKLHAQVSLILQESLMEVWRKCTQRFLNKKQLIQLILARKERISIDQFAHNAGYCPHIDFFAIFTSHQQLRRAVPSRRNVVSHVLFPLQFELPREAEVTDLELEILADEQVLRLDIAMHDVLSMEVVEPLEQLVDDPADERHFESVLRFLQDLQEIVLNILEYEIDDALLSESFLELNDIGVVGHLQNLHLSHGSFLCMLLVIAFLKFLDGHEGVGFNVAALQHHAVCALSNCRQDLVFLHLL